MDNNDHFSIHAHPSPETSIASKLVTSPDSPVTGDSNICKQSQAPLAWCLFENWEQYLQILTKLCHLYNLPMETIGKSICGRDIPMVRLGNGKHKVLYVGTHHGCEWLTGALLLRFIDAYGTAFSTRQRIAGVDLSFLYHTRSIFVVPIGKQTGAVSTSIATTMPDLPFARHVQLPTCGNTVRRADIAEQRRKANRRHKHCVTGFEKMYHWIYYSLFTPPEKKFTTHTNITPQIKYATLPTFCRVFPDMHSAVRRKAMRTAG